MFAIVLAQDVQTILADAHLLTVAWAKRCAKDEPLFRSPDTVPAFVAHTLDESGTLFLAADSRVDSSVRILTETVSHFRESGSQIVADCGSGHFAS